MAGQSELGMERMSQRISQSKSGQRPIGFRTGIMILVMAILTGIALVPAWREPMLARIGINTTPAPDFIASDQYGLEVFLRDGRSYLYGGDTFEDHFDITEFRLRVDQLKYGLGREWFPALIEPEFISLAEADETFRDEARMLVAKVGNEVHVYPLDTVKEYEVVNDRIGGVPVFAAYCYLADLGAVYDRRYGDHELTFAVSGYTYKDPQVWLGRNAFVLWDRDTESLWWPLLGRAVSGPLVDTPLKLLPETQWEQTTWGEAIGKRPDALVFKPRQEFDPPGSWPELDVSDLELGKVDPASPNAIAPHWGENGPATLPEATTMPSAPPA